MKPVRIGVIGCGVIGRHHVQAAAGAPEVELVAVADLNLAAARSLADEFAVAKVYDSDQALLADADVEAVVLALITGVRGDVALRALAAGKHVLLEKPPACNVAELERMQAAAAGLTIGCCSSRYTFLDGAARAQEIVAGGTLGALRVIRCRGISPVGAPRADWTPPSWRVSHRLNGGGYLVNWGVYDLDYLMHVTDWRLQPQTLLAQTWPIAPHLAAGRVAPGSDAENHVLVMIRCACGAVIHHERGEAVATTGDLAWQIIGERGSLRLQMVPQGNAPVVIHDDSDADTGLTSTTILESPGENRVHAMPVRDFAQAIRSGQPPRTDLKKAIRLQQILDGVYASARSGRALTFD